MLAPVAILFGWQQFHLPFNQIEQWWYFTIDAGLLRKIFVRLVIFVSLARNSY
jgi:hypothetical protein